MDLYDLTEIEEIKPDIEGEVVLSVWCSTYNHKDYIRDALEGFISQKTDFKYEVFIFDDASTDGTSDILRDYARRHPNLFHILIAKKNTWLHPKRREALANFIKKMVRGEFCALCEGDDFWIDPLKLQIQVNYMREHPECSIYLHNALRIDCRDLSIKTINAYDCNSEKELSPEEIIMMYNGHPPTASMLCRKEITTERPDFFYETISGDYTMQLYGLINGNLHYSNRIMSVYRWYSIGSSTSKNAESKEYAFNFNMGVLCFLLRYDKFTNYKYHIWIVNRIQAYAAWFLNNIELDINFMDYCKLCREHGYLLPSISETCLEKLELLRCQTFDMSYCSDSLKQFIKNYKYIVVMGIGKFASIITKQLNNNNIIFNGYAVSIKKDKEDYFMDKPVFKLSELTFAKEETGVIVAINPLRWDDIVNSLEAANIDNYYCPFLLEEI